MLIKRHLTSLVFIAAALLVSVYAYVVDRGKVSDPERNARGAALFPAFRRDEITRIELSKSGEVLILERPGPSGDWRLLSPVNATADAAAVETLMGALDTGNVIRRAEGQSFEAPRLRGIITMGKIVYRFALGTEAPVPEGAAYLKLDGEGSYVVGRDLVAQLLKAADTYRERTVVPYLSIGLRRLEVRGPAESWIIERTDDISFHMAEDPLLRVSRDGIDRVWSALAEARAESFISDTDADRGQEHAAVTVVVMTPKDGTKPLGELAVGGVCPEHPDDVIVVRRAPTRLSACAPKMILGGLATPKADLLDKHLFAARFDEVEELTLEPMEGAPSAPKLEIVRKGSGWHQRAPEDRELEKDEVDMANALVTQLVRGEGRLLERSTNPAANYMPRLRVTLLRAETDVREELHLDRTPHARVPGAVSPADEFIVRRAADGAYLAIDRELERKLEPRATALHGRELWSPPLEGKDVASIATSCARGGSRLEQELVREGTSFAMRKPAGYPADNGAALDVFEAVAHAKAESWVADMDDGSFGLADGCRVTVGVATSANQGSGPRTETLLMGRDAPDGGVFAQIAGRAPVFVVPKALSEMMGRPLVDRNVFFIDPPKLEAVTLKRAAATATVSRSAASGTDAGAESIFGAFGRMRAEEVLHLGAARPDEGFGSPSLEVRATLSTLATLAGDAGPRSVRFVFGRATLLHDQKMYFARVDGIDATFAIAKERIEPLLDAL